MSTTPPQSLLQGPGLIESRPPLAQGGLALLRSLASRMVARRPPMAWSLALLFTFKGTVCLATIAFPISSTEPVSLIGTAGCVAILGALIVWLFARRIPMLGFELLAACGTLVTSSVVAHASTHG